MFRLAALMVTACCTVSAAQASRPAVHARLNIEATSFVESLGTERARVEEEVAGILAEELDFYYKFLAWSPAPPGGGSLPGPAAEITLRIFSVPKPLGHAIEMELQTQVAGLALSPPEPASELYGELDDQPKEKEKSDILIDDLKEAIVGKLQNDSFRDNLEERFLEKIPLSNTVEADQELRVVMVPLTLKELQASRESEFSVEFAAVNQGQVEQDGSLILKPSGGRADKPGWVQCSVGLFRFPPDEVTSWHPNIPMVLGQDTLKRVVVYMVTYEMDTAPQDSSGRIAASLGGTNP